MVFFLQHYVIYRENNKKIAAGEMQIHEAAGHVTKAMKDKYGDELASVLGEVLSNVGAEDKKAHKTSLGGLKYNMPSATNTLQRLSIYKGSFENKADDILEKYSSSQQP